jgi:hypothetical protein
MSEPNSDRKPESTPRPASGSASTQPAPVPTNERSQPVPEIGGRKKGLDPTRYGDWEKNGRCIDF